MLMWIGVGVRWEGGDIGTPLAVAFVIHRQMSLWHMQLFDFSAGWECEMISVRSGIMKWLQGGVGLWIQCGVGLWNDFNSGWACEMTSRQGGAVKWLQCGVGLWKGLWRGGLCCCAELSAFLCDVPQAPYPWCFLQESLISQDFLYISIQKEHPYCSIVCLQLAVFSPVLSHTTWSYG